MSINSDIEWTDATWNPVRGCTKVSPGCKRCYAETFAERFRGVPGHPYERGFDPRLAPEMLDKPLRWMKPRTVFVNSMSDLFGEFVPSGYIAACFGVMAATTRHTYQVLTKRAQGMAGWFEWVDKREEQGRAMFPEDDAGWRIRQMLYASARNQVADVPPHHGGPWPLPNVWLGVSVEDRKYGLPRIEHLRRAPAALRFLSIEPLLEDLGEINLDGIGWVIVGGESGPGARPMHPDWARSIRDQCVAAKVPFFFKQWGGWAPGESVEGPVRRTQVTAEFMRPSGPWVYSHVTPKQSESMHHDDEPDLYRIGKKNAGRHLDGRTWDEMPAR